MKEQQQKDEAEDKRQDKRRPVHYCAKQCVSVHRVYSESSSVFLGTQCILRIFCVHRSPLGGIGHIDADRFCKGIN